MFIDSEIGFSTEEAGSAAKLAEDGGYDAIWSGEVKHDPLIILANAAASTSLKGRRILS